jgi:hypothetical protein
VTRRDLVALTGAVSLTAVLIWLLYLFFARIWVGLPAWAAVPLSILIAVGAIGGPVWALLRLSDRAWRRGRDAGDR